MVVYNAVIKTKPLDLEAGFKTACGRAKEAREAGADLAVFPSAFLSGPDLGILSGREYFEKSYNALAARLSAENPGLLIAADTYRRDEGFLPAFYLDGRILPGEREECRSLGVYLFSCFEKLRLRREREDFCPDLVILNETRPALAGKRALLCAYLEKLSQKSGRYIAINLGGAGRSSHPYVYMPMAGLFMPDGKSLISQRGQEGYLNCQNIYKTDKRKESKPDVILPPTDFPIEYSENPMIPACVGEREYCLDLFSLQSRALAARLDNLCMKRAVVALSGGLDSALALLVTVDAFDSLGLDRAGIKVVSMPGFGTGSTTRNLALKLAESLGFEIEIIDITGACRRALADIGHDGVTADVTFENVQARMRTLNGLNIANSIGGIMVGTGDLSEEALGFSTYGGDRLANYNVNSSVSKTVIRTMLPYVTQKENLAPAKEAIDRILSIPVSPELVPGDGEITQRTEEILAPYKLIDFYTYCFVRAKLSPRQTAEKAAEVFGKEYGDEYVREKAKMFFRRFVTGQFKRSRAPEGAALTHCALADFFGRLDKRSVPSDRPARRLADFPEFD